MRRQLAMLALLCVALATPLPNALGAQGPQPADSAARLAARADSAARRQTEDAMREAVALWDGAAALYRQAGQRADEGQMLHNVGRTLGTLGRSDSALGY